MGRVEQIKAEIAAEAARLLFEEEVRSYRDARRQASRRFNPAASSVRGSHLPEYREINAGLRQMLLFYGGDAFPRRVREWRILALKYLEILEPFQPLLVGSVVRGEVRALSDINLQLFCDKPEEIGYFLEAQRIAFEEEGDAESTRFYLEEDGIEIECRVYTVVQRRQRPRCGLTGKPMERVDYKGLRELIAQKDLSEN